MIHQAGNGNSPGSRWLLCLKGVRRLLSFPSCQTMISELQRQKDQAYRNRVMTAVSKRPSMTSEEFYRQMERSMGRKMIPISSEGGLIAARLRAEDRAQTGGDGQE